MQWRMGIYLGIAFAMGYILGHTPILERAYAPILKTAAKAEQKAAIVLPEQDLSYYETLLAEPVKSLEVPEALPNSPPVKKPILANYHLQVAAFPDAKQANLYIKELRKQKIEAFFVEALVNQKKVYRIRVGHYATQEEANAAKANWIKKYKKDAFVVSN